VVSETLWKVRLIFEDFQGDRIDWYTDVFEDKGSGGKRAVAAQRQVRIWIKEIRRGVDRAPQHGKAIQ